MQYHRHLQHHLHQQQLPLLLALLLLLMPQMEQSMANPALNKLTHCGISRYHASFQNFFIRPSGWHGYKSMWDKRIIGGQRSLRNEWPWLVSLRFTIHRDAQARHVCGGTLIARDWVLTAAHCFEPALSAEGQETLFSKLSNKARMWLVRVGEHDMLVDDGSHTDAHVKRIILHPRRRPYTDANDIALIQLKNKVSLGKTRNVACLPDVLERIPIGTECLTAGWGHTKESGPDLSPVPRHVSVPIVSTRVCAKAYNDKLKLRAEMIQKSNNVSKELVMAAMMLHMKNLTDGNMCAGDMVRGGRDSCQFDSGGPLMCRDPASKFGQQWQVTGIVSSGGGCGNSEFPGIYARVAAFIPWIEETMRG